MPLATGIATVVAVIAAALAVFLLRHLGPGVASGHEGGDDTTDAEPAETWDGAAVAVGAACD